jgi:hypothetical protein
MVADQEISGIEMVNEEWSCDGKKNGKLVL